MRPKPFSLSRDHAYARFNSPSHGHFDTTTQRMPAYSLEATPFRWVMRGADGDPACPTWGIEIDDALEERADALMEFESDWIQDHENQLALLDSFFSSLHARKSLVFLYAKDVPLLEERAPGARILVGAGFVDEVRPVVEWNYKADGPLRSIMWERAVLHSIRPSFPGRVPASVPAALGESRAPGRRPAAVRRLAPGEHFDDFSYVTELVGPTEQSGRWSSWRAFWTSCRE